jgi:hypothetical protein
MDGHDALFVCVAFIFGVDCCCGVCGKGEGMKQEDIIRLAREAGFADGVVDIVGAEGFANFAALVAAHEREACAKVCEAEGRRIDASWSSCAAAIRSRT